MAEPKFQKAGIRPKLVVCALLFIITFLVYLPVIHHDFINLDDPFYVAANYHVNQGVTAESIKWAFVSFHVSNWHPVTWLSHMLDCQLFGLDPGMHHATNMIFHILNSLLLFFVFFRTTAQIWPSAFIAAFFALHPMHVESVAWISERKDVLSTFFMFLTFLFYISYSKSRKKVLYWTALVVFALGLMSKPMLVTLPFLLLVFDYWPLGLFVISKEGSASEPFIKTDRPLLLEKIPFFMLAGVSSFITVMAQSKGGAIATITAYPLSIRFCNSVIAYLEYIIKMLNPVNLAIFYPYPESIDKFHFFISLSVLIAISLTAVCTAKRLPFFVSGWLWYLITLVPVIGIVQVGNQAIADRYTYVSYTGLFVVVVFGLYRLFSKYLNNSRIVHVLFIVFIIFFMFVTRFQIGLWKNSITILSHAINVTEKNYVANINLGGALTDEKKYLEAVNFFSEAAKIKPDSRVAHSNLGVALMMTNQYEKAIQSFLKAIELKPDLEVAYYNIGYIYSLQGRHADATEFFNKTIQINPGNANAYNNLGAEYANQGDFGKALLNYERAYQLGHNSAKKNIDQLLLMMDRM